LEAHPKAEPKPTPTTELKPSRFPHARVGNQFYTHGCGINSTPDRGEGTEFDFVEHQSTKAAKPKMAQVIQLGLKFANSKSIFRRKRTTVSLCKS